MQGLLAHSPNIRGDWQGLLEHLEGTRDFARSFAERFDAADAGAWVGFHHDVGKAHPAWQAWLREVGEKGLSREAARRMARPDHRAAGAWLALEGNAALLGLVVLGHHGGLPAARDLEELRQGAANADIAPALQAFGATIVPPSLPRFAERDRVSLETLGRFLFSALVDADSLDTEAHSLSAPRPPAPRLEAGRLLKALENHRLTLKTREMSPAVAAVREQVFLDCLAAAELPPGVFRLTAPTGAGKTLAALGFALRHAEAHNRQRIIVAMPYLTIIEQTADTYRAALDIPPRDGQLLEHHSGIVPEEALEPDPAQLSRRAAVENWDAPLVVTTTVQLFESLFAHRRTPCRKLHRIARSVIILDEVQALPVGLLAPILAMLRALTEDYGVTVVLATATQPAFEGESPFLRGFATGSVREMVQDAPRHFVALRRVKYEVEAAPLPWPEVAARMRERAQCLAILNTRKQTLALLDALEDAAALHLSTYLCGAHRREVLDRVRGALREGRPCRLVSTQVVEAGVDLDFPAVLRAMGPLDRIAQAAGRCNREGRLNEGVVTVFTPEDDAMPAGVYRTAADLARSILHAEGLDLNDPATFGRYFEELYQLSDTDSEGIERMRQAPHYPLDYPEVAQRFRIIAQDTVSVVVPYLEAARVLDELDRWPSAAGWRALQDFIVHLYPGEATAALRDGRVRERSSGAKEWTGTYDPRLGIGRQASDPARLIIG